MPWPSSPYFLFNAADITDADGTTLATVPDQSGNGRNLTVAGGTVTVRTNAWNSNRALEFASASYATLAGTFDRRNTTILMVVKSTDPMCNSSPLGIYRGLAHFGGGGLDHATNTANFYSLTYFNGVGNNTGMFAPDYDTVLSRLGPSNIRIRCMGGDITGAVLGAGSYSGISFGGKSGGASFVGVKRIALIAVWDRVLSDTERDDAMAMALADYPRAGTLWSNTLPRVMICGTSVMAGYATTTEANTIGRLIQPAIPQISNLAVSGSFIVNWTDWSPDRIDPYLPGSDVKILVMDAPRNNVTAAEPNPQPTVDAWYAYFAARKAAVPGVLTVGTTMLALGGNTTGSTNFNNLILPEYDAWPIGGANAYKIKSTSTKIGQAPDYLYHAAANTSITTNMPDGTHPNDTGTAAYATGLQELLQAVITANTPVSEPIPPPRKPYEKMDNFYYIGQFVRRAGMTDANTPNYYGGASTQATYRIEIPIPSTVQPFNRIRLRFGNQQNAAILVRGSVVKGSGAIYPVSFNSGGFSFLQKGEECVSDWIPLSGEPGDTFYFLSNPSVLSAGEKWPVSAPTYNARTGDGIVDGSDVTLTNTGFTQAGQFGFYPISIEADCGLPSPAVLVLGDSIICGVGDTGYGLGWAARACASAGLANQMSGLSGERLDLCLSTTWRERAKQYGFGTAVIEYGINDLNNNRTFAQLKADITTAVARLVGAGFEKILVCTLTPYDTFNATKNGHRTDYNNWLRGTNGNILTDLPAVSAVVDVASVVESLTSGGTVAKGGTFYAGGMSGDGVHPNATGHTVMGVLASPIILNFSAPYPNL